MNSQLRFVMHPGDEDEFAAHLLSDEQVQLIDGPHWKNETPECFRTLDGIKGDCCIIWSAADIPALEAVLAHDRWVCRSEAATIQFLRSRMLGPVVTEGRIAVSTSYAREPLTVDCTNGVETRYRALSRFIKKRYANSMVEWFNPAFPAAPATPQRSANPSQPDRQVWVGPHALRWLQADRARRVKQFATSIVEARLSEAV